MEMKEPGHKRRLRLYEHEHVIFASGAIEFEFLNPRDILNLHVMPLLYVRGEYPVPTHVVFQFS